MLVLSELPRLKSCHFSGESAHPHLLITAGVHGDELEPIAALQQLARWLPNESMEGSVTLVPVVNERAFELGRRTADDQKDLARVCPGTPNGSVTERVASVLTQLILSADYYVDLHTGGTALSVYPLAGYLLHANLDVLDAQRSMARAASFPIVWGTDPDVSGRTLSVARDAEIPAIYVEYRGGGAFESGGVGALVKACLNVASECGVLSRPASRRPIRWTVEDPRAGSGHMQGRHPSPGQGCFSPTVQLGDFVRAGQQLGMIVDLSGDRLQVVQAQESGMVIVIHRFGPVKKGDGLAVVLDVSTCNSPDVASH